MIKHWTDRLSEPQQESDYANWPHGDNVHVRRLADAQRDLSEICFADAAIEAERQALLARANDIRTTLAETQVSLVVAGGWNAGKSTLINAFLCESWMPTNVNRETVTVNRILDGEEQQLQVFFRDDRKPLHETYSDAQDVHKKIQNLGRRERDTIERIDVCYPKHSFLKWCAIIDTPGLDFSQEDSVVSQPLIDEADVLLWVMHIEGPREQDIQALRIFRQRNSGSRILAVANYADLLDESEYNDVYDDKQERLKQYADAIFLVSAKCDLEQKESDRGFKQLRAYLNEQILPAYGALQNRRPTRLACECVDQMRLFSEKARRQPLKASSPYRLGENNCWTARELAIALSKKSVVALPELKQILRWVRDDLKDPTLMQMTEGLIQSSTLIPDERLLCLLIRFAPDLPPTWRGVSLAPSDLIIIAQRAEQDQTTQSHIKAIYDHRVFEMCVRAGLSGYQSIQDGWENAVTQCKDAWQRTENAGAPKYFDLHIILPSLLLLQLQKQSDSMLRQLVKIACSNIDHKIYWFKELGEAETAPAAVLILMLKLSPMAKDQSYWERARLENSKESYYFYLSSFPDGIFAEDAHEKLSKIENSVMNSKPIKKLIGLFK